MDARTIKTKKEFDTVYKNSRRMHGKGFVLHIARIAGLQKKGIFLESNPKARKASAHKIGLSVSKKIGSAPLRNLFKRRFRALAHDHRQLINGLAIVFVPRVEIREQSFLNLERSFLQILKSYREHD